MLSNPFLIIITATMVWFNPPSQKSKTPQQADGVSILQCSKAECVLRTH